MIDDELNVSTGFIPVNKNENKYCEYLIGYTTIGPRYAPTNDITIFFEEYQGIDRKYEQ